MTKVKVSSKQTGVANDGLPVPLKNLKNTQTQQTQQQNSQANNTQITPKSKSK